MTVVKAFAGLLLMLLISACGEAPEKTVVDAAPSVAAAATDEPAVAAALLTQRQMQQWSSSCALCHASGVANAPVTGSIEQWQPRLAQGKDTLLAHTLEGFNSMPPLGYCMSCEREDFSAMIDFMLGGAQ